MKKRLRKAFSPLAAAPWRIGLSARDLVTIVVMLVAMLIVLAITAIIAVPIAIPFVAVLKAAAIALPIAVVIETAFEAWTNPARAGIRGTRPITFVPAVMSMHGIPVALNPDKTRARWRWRNDHSRRGRRTNPDANANLRACVVGAEQQNRGKEHKSHQAFHLISFRRSVKRRQGMERGQ